MRDTRTIIASMFDVALHLPEDFSKDGLQIIPKYEATLDIDEEVREIVKISCVETFNYTKDYINLKMSGGTELSLTEEGKSKLFVHKETLGDVTYKRLCYIKEGKVTCQIKLAYKDVSTMKLDIIRLTNNSDEDKTEALVKLLDKGTDNLTRNLMLVENLKAIDLSELERLLEHQIYELNVANNRIEIINR